MACVDVACGTLQDAPSSQSPSNRGRGEAPSEGERDKQARAGHADVEIVYYSVCNINHTTHTQSTQPLQKVSENVPLEKMIKSRPRGVHTSVFPFAGMAALPMAVVSFPSPSEASRQAAPLPAVVRVGNSCRMTRRSEGAVDELMGDNV